MEWRKAIKILIFSFILLNLALAINLWYRKQPTPDIAVAELQEQEILEILKRRGISLKTKLPVKGNPQPLLEVSYEDFDADILASKLFEDQDYQRHQKDSDTIYSFESKQLIISENGVVNYKNTNPQRNGMVSCEKAHKIALDFIENLGGLPEDAVFMGAFVDDEACIIRYCREYDGFLLANSLLEIKVASEVEAFRKCWLVPLGYYGEAKDVIDPEDAILKATEERKESKSTVIMVSQGFYSKLYNAQNFQEPPVWIIGFDDGTNYYINAYTGQLEE